MGIDPVTLAAVAPQALSFLDKLFGVSGGSSGPSAEQLMLMQQQQAAAQAAATQRWLLIGGMVAAVGLVFALRR